MSSDVQSDSTLKEDIVIKNVKKENSRETVFANHALTDVRNVLMKNNVWTVMLNTATNVCQTNQINVPTVKKGSKERLMMIKPPPVTLAQKELISLSSELEPPVTNVLPTVTNVLASMESNLVMTVKKATTLPEKDLMDTV